MWYKDAVIVIPSSLYNKYTNSQLIRNKSFKMQRTQILCEYIYAPS